MQTASRLLLCVPLTLLALPPLLDAQQRVTALGLGKATTRRGVVDPTSGEAMLPSASSTPRRDWVFSPSLRGWQPRPASNHLPTATAFFSVVADTTRNRVVLFGGSPTRAFTGIDETWEWDGTDWQRIATPTSPPPRTAAAACFDAGRGRTVLFGGLHDGAALDDVWEYDGTTWIDRTVHPAPAPGASRLAYDPVRALAVLRGSDGTWEWDGTNWRGPLDPTPIPTSGAIDVVWDSATAAIVTTGGHGALEAWNGSAWIPVPTNTAPFGAATVMTLQGGPQRGLLVVDTDTRTWIWDGTTWSLRGSPGSAPGYGPDRMVFDPNRGRLLLVDAAGTVFAFAPPSQTWRQLTATGGPVVGSDHCIAYDAARDRLVAFGRARTIGGITATFLWDPTTGIWEERQPAVQPSGFPRGLSMEYDPVRQRCVLFGSPFAGNPRPSTWEWDGTRWHEFRTSSGPDGLPLPALAFDTDREVMVLIQGGDAATWEWDGTSWTLRGTLHPPGNTSLWPAAVYHPARRRMQVLRQETSNAARPTLYEIDLERLTWTRADLTAPGLDVFGNGILWNLAHDPDAATTYAVFASSLPVHALTSVAPAVALPYGAGCPTSVATVPSLRGLAARSPWLGDRFAFRVERLAPATRTALLLVGVSASRWGGGALPFDLGPLGFTGCSLLASAEITLPLQASSGSIEDGFDVPTDPGLLQVEAFTQVFALDLGANPAGVVGTNALRLVLGAR